MVLFTLLASLFLVMDAAWSESLTLRCGAVVSRKLEGEDKALPDLPFSVNRGYGYIGGTSGALDAGPVRGWPSGAPVSWR
ncbi:MAG TPA: hypothetical protein DD471_12900, partial [Planctomycetes bacterium]|nr:hypothetical protein [Planctomycetota bacterium]